MFDIVRGYPWPLANHGRALRNRFVDTWQGHEDALSAAAHSERSAYQAAAGDGDFETAVVWAGEAVDLIGDVESAATLVARIGADAQARLRLGAKQVVN